MALGRSFTLSDLARRLDVPQHQLIHLCEKEVLVPEVQDAHGRGSSRVFSERNFLEIAIALRFREAMLPIAVAGAVLHVLREFEASLGRDFTLPESLCVDGAPDLRIIISDGGTIYFSLRGPTSPPELFGGIPLEQITGNRPGPIGTALDGEQAAGEGEADRRGFGGPEGSQFLRLELSVTEVARALPLD